MQRIFNKAANYVDEMLEGVYLAHSDIYKFLNEDKRCLIRNNLKKGKVAIVSGGGSGHFPLFLGFVGNGMLDGFAAGGIFNAPNTMQAVTVAKGTETGSGILYLYANYEKNIECFTEAEALINADGLEIDHVIVADDVASAPRGKENKRRGSAGLFFVIKIAGAAASSMLPLSEVKRLAKKAAVNTRTMGVTLAPCGIPEAGKYSFILEDGKMEIGMGLHGEPGLEKQDLKSANEIVDIILPKILNDLPFEKNDDVALLINGLGATPMEELYIMNRRIAKHLTGQKIHVFHTYVGEFVTAMDMAGATISLIKLDDELKKYLSMPCYTPHFAQQQLSD